MTRVAARLTPLVLILGCGLFAVHAFGIIGGTRNENRGSYMTIYASSTGPHIIVEAKVDSDVRGRIWSTESGKPMVARPPFRKQFPVNNGERLTAIINAGIPAAGGGEAVTCLIQADDRQITQDTTRKQGGTDPPDVHCRGVVFSPPA